MARFSLGTLRPALVESLRGYSRQAFVADLVAGLTGLHALEGLRDRLKKSGRSLILCGAPSQPAELLHQAEFVQHVGADNIVPHVQAALDRARQIRAGFSGVG